MQKKSLSENITDILSISRLAPSVHNIQPWQVKIEGDLLLISKSPQRQLQDGDPTGRQTTFCLGIFTEACLIGLRANGFDGEVDLMPDGVIRIKTQQLATTANNGQSDVQAMKLRFTDRSIYKKLDISEEYKDRIKSAWKSPAVEIQVVSDPGIIDHCAALTKQGLMLALSSPGFRSELAHYLVPSNKTPFGIPTPTLQTSRLKAVLIKKLIASGARRKAEAELELKRWRSASALVFILATGDSPVYWFEGGRAYLRAAIEIEKLGLRQATSAAIVEASDFHEDIEKLLGTKKRILGLLRVGNSDTKRVFSGRYEPEELLIT
jgi:hypothetical protein